MQSLRKDSDEDEYLALLEQELAYKASQSLDEYCRYIEVPGAPVNEEEEQFYPESIEPAEHHRLLNSKLEMVESGEIKRLMVLMPPGTAKSTYASVVFPTWFMGKNPKRSIITVSYAADLAKKFGRKCRQIAKSKTFHEVFNTGVVSDNKAADDWALDNQSNYMSSGMLGGITGNRADGVICDDPVKGRQEADSKVTRDNVWEAWISDLRTRIKPGGWIVLILTRWHEDDVAGRILPENYSGESGWITARDGEEWYVLCIQAECERADDPLHRKIGEFLWTEWFSVEHWLQEKRTQGGRNWASLFQQKPSPDEGTYFQRSWFKRFTLGEEPKVNKYLSSDFAVTEDDGDFTELGCWGMCKDEDLWALDWYYDQSTPDKWIDAELDLVKRHKPYGVFGEKGVIRRAIEPFLMKRSRKRKIYARFEWLARTADKQVKGRPFQAMAASGKVHIPYGPWGDRLIEQLVSFPAGKHDDAVDNCTLMGMAIDEAHAAIVPFKEPEKAKTDYDDDDESGESWRT